MRGSGAASSQYHYTTWLKKRVGGGGGCVLSLFQSPCIKHEDYLSTCSDGPLPGAGVHSADLVVMSEQGLHVRSVVHRPDLHRPYSDEGESRKELEKKESGFQLATKRSTTVVDLRVSFL